MVPAVAGAQVVERAPNAFMLKTELTVSAPPLSVYNLFVNEIDQWWDDAHTFSGDAGNFWLQPNPGGCLCETLANGGGVEHAEVIHVVPGELVRMRASLGPLQEYAIFGAWTWTFAPADRGETRVIMQYNVTGSFPGGLDKVADAVNTVLSDQVRRLKEHVEAAMKRPVLPIPR
jgi:uncharacterized protein YndB with AHSA1/START domain